MTKLEFTCFKDFSTSRRLHLYFLVLFSILPAMLLQFILLSASPAYAEEPKVFTDADLVNYKAEPMVDQETQARLADDLKAYEKKRDAASLLDREKRKRQKAEEAKRPALQKQSVTSRPGKKRS